MYLHKEYLLRLKATLGSKNGNTKENIDAYATALLAEEYSVEVKPSPVITIKLLYVSIFIPYQRINSSILIQDIIITKNHVHFHINLSLPTPAIFDCIYYTVFTLELSRHVIIMCGYACTIVYLL